MREKAKGYKPEPEYERNPALDFPRNYKCFCKSGKKFKVCCFPKLEIFQRHVTKEDAERIRKAIKNEYGI